MKFDLINPIKLLTYLDNDNRRAYINNSGNRMSSKLVPIKADVTT